MSARDERALAEARRRQDTPLSSEERRALGIDPEPAADWRPEDAALVGGFTTRDAPSLGLVVEAHGHLCRVLVLTALEALGGSASVDALTRAVSGERELVVDLCRALEQSEKLWFDADDHVMLRRALPAAPMTE